MPPHVPPVRRSGCSDGFKVKVRFSVHCHDRLRTNQTWRASLFWTWSMSRVVLHFTQCRRCRWTKNRKEGCPGFEFDLSPGIFVHDLESTVDVWAGEKTNDSKFGLPLAFFRCSCCDDLFLLFLFLKRITLISAFAQLWSCHIASIWFVDFVLYTCSSTHVFNLESWIVAVDRGSSWIGKTTVVSL